MLHLYIVYYTCILYIGLPHHIWDGSSIDPDHTCEESDVTMVSTNFLRTKEGNMVRWSCMGCRHSYHHGTAACSKLECSTICGHTKGQVIKLMMYQVGSMLRQIQSWDPLHPDSDAPETMTGNMLAELVLSPHNSHLRGLCAANWEVVTEDDDISTCRCTVLKEQQAVVTPVPQAVPEVTG